LDGRLVSELRDLLGQELGPSSWIDVTQERINAFAAATDDHQWIHVDAARAGDGPFGTAIAHGFLTLSLALDGRGRGPVQGVEKPVCVADLVVLTVS
jgi:acyl dehydratase